MRRTYEIKHLVSAGSHGLKANSASDLQHDTLSVFNGNDGALSVHRVKGTLICYRHSC
jgi:hypothetical protein